MSVKRYKCDMTSTEAGHLPLLSLAVEPYTCAPEGEYVLHSDYESLKAEVKRLEQESAKWRRAEHAVGDKCIEFAKTIQTLKAENGAYRSASDEVAAAFLALPNPHNQVARLCEGIESLKAEVEEQAKRWAKSEDLISHYKQQRDEAYNDCKCLGLKAELENANRINRELLVLCNQQANKIRKLTEAGDEMAFHIGNDMESQLKCSDQWRATKES